MLYKSDSHRFFLDVSTYEMERSSKHQADFFQIVPVFLMRLNQVTLGSTLQAAKSLQLYRNFFYHRSYLSTATTDASGSGTGTGAHGTSFEGLLSVCHATFLAMETLLSALNEKWVPRTWGMVCAHMDGVRALANVFKVT